MASSLFKQQKPNTFLNAVFGIQLYQLVRQKVNNALFPLHPECRKKNLILVQNNCPYISDSSIHLYFHNTNIIWCTRCDQKVLRPNLAAIPFKRQSFSRIKLSNSDCTNNIQVLYIIIEVNRHGYSTSLYGSFPHCQTLRTTCMSLSVVKTSALLHRACLPHRITLYSCFTLQNKMGPIV